MIDTDDSNDYHGTDDATKSTIDQNISNLTSSTPLVDDLFGDFSGSVESSIEQKNDDDPFADVSFHTNEKKGDAEDLFSGMTVGDKQGDDLSHGLGSVRQPDSFDIFASESIQGNHNEFVSDLMSGLSIDENKSSTEQKTTSPAMQSESLLSGLNNQISHQAPDNALAGVLSSQAAGFNYPMFSTGHLPYNVHPGIMLNHSYPSQPLNYSAMGSLLAQPQFLATMANFQHLSNVSMQDAGVAQGSGTNGRAAMPDIFQSNLPTQTPTSMISSSKKEETKAFDFISVSVGIDIQSL